MMSGARRALTGVSTLRPLASRWAEAYKRGRDRIAADTRRGWVGRVPESLMPDHGLTHVALLVGDVEASLAFYARYAAMQVVHERTDATTGSRVAWISDRTRPFVIVLVQAPPSVPRRLRQLAGRLMPGVQHLGVGCPSRAEVERLCAEAHREGRLRSGPTDSGYPVGYWAFIDDPDGHILELSFGQEVGLTVETR